MKVHIYTDDLQFTFPVPVDETDDSPSFYLPVEVPDDVMAAYDQAYAAWTAIRHHIVDTYGHSEMDPEYPAKLAAWDAAHPAAVQIVDVFLPEDDWLNDLLGP